MMQNTDHQQPIDKISGTLEPKRNGSKTKQPDRGVQPNESDIYMVELPQKEPDPPTRC